MVVCVDARRGFATYRSCMTRSTTYGESWLMSRARRSQEEVVECTSPSMETAGRQESSHTKWCDIQTTCRQMMTEGLSRVIATVSTCHIAEMELTESVGR